MQGVRAEVAEEACRGCGLMREILFRGKDIKTGEWVDGCLLKVSIENEVFWMIFCDRYTFDGSDVKSTTHAAVDSNTIGQYTGLKDKNGKRIFEGDLLKPFDDEIDKMVVEFHHGGFVLCLYGDRGYRSESGEWEYDGSNYGVIECEPLSSYGEDIEVIGNIHDNPEMLMSTVTSLFLADWLYEEVEK